MIIAPKPNTEVSLPIKRLVIFACAILVNSGAARADLIQGIDVSHWQGSINWTSVKNAGVKFAFVKATEGVGYTDPTFSANMNGAKANGVLAGPYHFCRLDSGVGHPQDPVNEANYFLSKITPYYQSGQHLPPVADVEGFPPFGSNDEAQAFTSTWVQQFSNTVYNALGVRPIIYTSLSKANTYYTRSISGTHPLWLAWWKGTGTTQPPVQSDTPLWQPWKFWQWTDSWSVPGVAGNVDGDVFSGDAQALDKLLLGNDGMPGDYNDDDVVDAADYAVWRRTMGQKVPLFTRADGNGNAIIDAGDFNVWRANFGEIAGGGAGGGGNVNSSGEGAVPEPTGLVLLLAGSIMGFIAKRR